jgi:TonB family protein
MLRFAGPARRLESNGRLVFIMSALILIGFPAIRLAAQFYEPGSNDRKVISRVDPEYPDTLKRLYIGGVVRVEAVVAPNGTVRKTQLLGGNPILGQSTMKAVTQWKFAPAPADEVLTVKIVFDPHR